MRNHFHALNVWRVLCMKQSFSIIVEFTWMRSYFLALSTRRAWWISDLHCHQTLHMGEKPFAYTECNKRFVKKDPLWPYIVYTGWNPISWKIVSQKISSTSQENFHEDWNFLTYYELQMSIHINWQFNPYTNDVKISCRSALFTASSVEVYLPDHL